MNTEELREQAEDKLHFDAHEFDGLREALEQEAKGLLARADRFVRENPMLCIGLAAAAGFTLAAVLGHSQGPSRPEQEPIDSRRM
jgi:ElaB/YqjD/DUF883 family membrane-anchored ribosome-binding protein